MARLFGFILILIILAGVYLFFKITRLEYKIVISGVVLFVFLFSIGYLFELQNHDIDYLSFEGVQDAFSIYFSWLFSIFDGLKFFTSNSVAIDYEVNNSLS